VTTRRLPRLMLVTDRRHAKFPLSDLARRAIGGGVDVVQVREKDLRESEVRELIAGIIAAVPDRSCIAVNGELALAAEFGIGVHLPECGLSPADARKLLGEEVLIGRSVHSPDTAAQSVGADYLIAGHVFVTPSKPDLPPIGLDGLRQIIQAATAPVLAIGGVTAANVQSVLDAGAYGAAVLSAINAATDPETAARRIRAQMILE
jgi:thiamine-phosphate pyrophosphorylase